jgi:hypothetical protein
MLEVGGAPTATSPEAPLPPGYRLYSPAQVALASLFGAPLAGGILLYLNQRRLGRARPGLALLAGLGLTAAMVAIAWPLPDVATRGIPLAGVLATWQTAKAWQGEAHAAHLAARGVPGSSWRAAGVGLAAMVALLALGFVVVVAFDLQPGPHVDLGGGQVVTYEDGVSEAEARHVGELLRAAGYFNDQGPHTASLERHGEVYAVSVALVDGAWDRPEIEHVFAELRRRISEEALGGARVELRLCDDWMSARRTLR